MSVLKKLSSLHQADDAAYTVRVPRVRRPTRVRIAIFAPTTRRHSSGLSAAPVLWLAAFWVSAST